ncbi:S1 family peptidase [Endozoicomonas acroporae]|uniref:S1 family peptidase n=1 Tax=Endozoicomonas acroporae TaxID=1701104 RepID=UPI0013D54133|nr:serine protease [Endozoicomonas acroporae]
MKSVIKKILRCICKISTPSGNGTGFLIQSTSSRRQYLVTNCHVIENDDTAELTFYDLNGNYETHELDPLKVLICDYSRDIAIIDINDFRFFSHQAIEYKSFHKFEVGDHFYSGGFPIDSESPRVVEGILSGVQLSSINSVGHDVHILDATIHYGQSGSPVFDSKGYLKSIIYAKSPHHGIGYSFPLECFSDMVDFANSLSKKLYAWDSCSETIEVDVEVLAQFQDWCAKNALTPVPRLACNSDRDSFVSGSRRAIPNEFKELINPILDIYLDARPSGGRFYVTGQSVFSFCPDNERYKLLATIENY